MPVLLLLYSSVDLSFNGYMFRMDFSIEEGNQRIVLIVNNVNQLIPIYLISITHLRAALYEIILMSTSSEEVGVNNLIKKKPSLRKKRSLRTRPKTYNLITNEQRRKLLDTIETKGSSVRGVNIKCNK